MGEAQQEDNVRENTGDAERVSVARIAELAAGYLASAVLLFYPIGLLSTGLQLWVAYEYPLLDSLYAAALVPVPAAVAQLVYSLYWFLTPYVAAQLISELVREKSDPPLMHRTPRQRRLTWITVILVVTAPLIVIQPEYILTLRGFALWIGFALAALAGGVCGGLLHRGAQDRWQHLAANVVVYLFAILGAVLLTGSEGPHLPLVEVEGGTGAEARLLSHRDGYWYLFCPDGTLSAVPEDEAGHVVFLRE